MSSKVKVRAWRPDPVLYERVSAMFPEAKSDNELITLMAMSILDAGVTQSVTKEIREELPSSLSSEESVTKFVTQLVTELVTKLIEEGRSEETTQLPPMDYITMDDVVKVIDVREKALLSEIDKLKKGMSTLQDNIKKLYAAKDNEPRHYPDLVDHSDNIVLEVEPPAYAEEVQDIVDEWGKAMERFESEELGVTLPDSIKQPEAYYNDDPHDDSETV